jgi:integrase
MSARRASGSVRRLPSGRWQARHLDPAGVRHTVGTYRTRREAEQGLAAAVADMARGTWRDPGHGSETLGEYLERYLARRQGVARPRTQVDNQSLARLYILAPVPLGRRTITLGDVPLNAITPALVADWYAGVRTSSLARANERATAGAARRRVTPTVAARRWARAAGYQVGASGRLSPEVVNAWRAAGSPAPKPEAREVPAGAGFSTAVHAYRLLRAVLNAAVDDELIVRNPCRIRGGGVDRPAEREVATPAQVAAITAAMPGHWRALVPVTAWGCLRQGEALGLQRGDISFTRDDAGTITGARLALTRALVTVRGRVSYGPLKTAASRRTVPLPASAARALAEHMDTYTGPGAKDPVFAAAEGGLVDQSKLGAAWRAARGVAGRPDLHFHDLRHTGATEARRAGADLPALQRLLGHTSLAMVARYQHVAHDDLDLIAAALEARLSTR